jgi:hypothetical protein
VWKDGDPVQVVKNLHLPRFTLEKFLTDSCNSKTNTGKLHALYEPRYLIPCVGNLSEEMSYVSLNFPLTYAFLKHLQNIF